MTPICSLELWSIVVGGGIVYHLCWQLSHTAWNPADSLAKCILNCT